MKLTQLILAVCIAANFVSCKEKTEDPQPAKTETATSADVAVLFSNEVDGQPIEFSKMKYTNAAGNLYQVDLLKYYVTNMILVKSDMTEVKLQNYDLINAADVSTCSVNAIKVPNGTYNSIKFNIGLPADRNHNGAQDGDLDPVMGMVWDWNTGYVFFKHEGRYENSGGMDKSLVFHFATDRALTNIEVPLTTPLVVNGTAKKVFLTFNLNKLYTTPTDVDFNADNNHQSSSAADEPWIDNLKASFSDVFSLNKIE